MIDVEITGLDKAAAAIDNLPMLVAQALQRKMEGTTIDLANYIVTQKLNGQVLQHRSGALKRSINRNVTANGLEILGRVFSSGDVKYAAIHEYGGVITPKNASALRFQIDGKWVHAKKVTMPERSFMRSSLAENKAQIIAGLQKAAINAARKAMA